MTSYEYDASGEHLLRVTAPGNRVTTYSYYTGGNLAKRHALVAIVHPDSTEEHFTYDDRGRLTETSTQGCSCGENVTYTYDTAGGVTVTDATGRQSFQGYGLGGQVAQVRDGNGSVVALKYDSSYQLTQVLGASSEKYSYSYDANGNLVAIQDPLRQLTTFGYESSFQQISSIVDPRGNGMRYAYDSHGNLTSITYQDGTREVYAYDAQGNVLTWTNRRGQTITYTYNAAGQVTSKDYPTTPGTIDFRYGYDTSGNLTSTIGPEGTTSFVRDAVTGLVMRINYPGGQLFTFAYDAVGRRKRRTDQEGNVVNYAYDIAGRLDRLTDGAGT